MAAFLSAAVAKSPANPARTHTPSLQAATIPFDTTKVRMQIRNNAVASGSMAASSAGGAGAGPASPPGFLGTLTHIAKSEGAGALFRGLTPGLQRQLLFGSIRLGLYEPVWGWCATRTRVDREWLLSPLPRAD